MKNVRCYFYGKGCDTEMRGSLLDDRKLVCSQCAAELEAALAARTESGGHAVQCQRCLLIYPSWRKLCVHWFDEHADASKEVFCPVCKEPFPKTKRGLDSFTEHMKKTRFQPHVSAVAILDAIDRMGKS